MNNVHLLIHYFTLLLGIVNPFGNLAVFISFTKNKSDEEIKAIIVTCSIAAGITLLVSTWIGAAILNFFDISLGAFQVAGAIIVLSIGFSMIHYQMSGIRHTPAEDHAAKSQESIAIVPLAIPIVTGPGSMAVAISAANHYHTFSEKIVMSGADIGIAALTGLVFVFAKPVNRFLGTNGTGILSRIMGLLLMAMGMEMLGSGLGKLFPMWVK